MTVQKRGVYATILSRTRRKIKIKRKRVRTIAHVGSFFFFLAFASDIRSMTYQVFVFVFSRLSNDYNDE